ncbi:hypothetical protein AAFA46_04310 [Oscillospiraceae bacterium WX1]
MALVEKNENLKGKTVKMDGLVISWDDGPDAIPDDALAVEDGSTTADKKPLKTKNDDLKTKKVVI